MFSALTPQVQNTVGKIAKPDRPIGSHPCRGTLMISVGVGSSRPCRHHRQGSSARPCRGSSGLGIHDLNVLAAHADLLLDRLGMTCSLAIKRDWTDTDTIASRQAGSSSGACRRPDESSSGRMTSSFISATMVNKTIRPGGIFGRPCPACREH